MTIGSFIHHFIHTCSYIHCLLENAWKQINSIDCKTILYCIVHTHMPHLFLHVRLLILQSIVESVKLPGLCQCSRNCRQTHTNTHTYVEVDHTNTHTHTYIYTHTTTTHFSMPFHFVLTLLVELNESLLVLRQFSSWWHFIYLALKLSYLTIFSSLNCNNNINQTLPNQTNTNILGPGSANTFLSTICITWDEKTTTTTTTK